MKVSVIIPFREDRGWLNQAINSVEIQTYKNIELIISQGNCGVSKNINKGIEQSTGDLIKYLCDDDVLPPNAIEQSVKAFKSKEVDFIHGNSKEFRGEIVSVGFVYKPLIKSVNIENMLTTNHIHGGTLMYRKEVFEQMGMFNETLWTGEEYEFNLRCLYHGLRCDYVDATLYYYRRHDKQKSVGNQDKNYQKMRKEQIEIIKSWYR